MQEAQTLFACGSSDKLITAAITDGNCTHFEESGVIDMLIDMLGIHKG